MTLRQWCRAKGAFNSKALVNTDTPAQTANALKFVEALFKVGATGASSKVRPSEVRTSMDLAKGPDGLPLFGPGPRFPNGNAWKLSKIASTYAMLFNGQKTHAAIASDASSVKCMSGLKCGCGAKGQGVLKLMGATTLGGVVALGLLEPAAFVAKLAAANGPDGTVKPAAVRKWIAALKLFRATAGQ